MDDRDLNYGKYFTDGEPWATGAEDYTSHNTERLDVAGLEALLVSLPEIREELKAAGCL
jgi:UDP-glucose 4-epimerase